VAFVGGSISTPGSGGVHGTSHEERRFRCALALVPRGQRPGDNGPNPALICWCVTVSGHSLELRRVVTRKKHASFQPGCITALSFVDMGGHGYSVVHAASDRLENGLHLPAASHHPQDQPDGGPILYRVRHAAKLWRKHERPKSRAEGDRRQSCVSI